MTKRLQHIVMTMLLLFAAGVGEAWGDFNPTEGKPYVIKYTGSALYIDMEQYASNSGNNHNMDGSTNGTLSLQSEPYVIYFKKNNTNWDIISKSTSYYLSPYNPTSKPSSWSIVPSSTEYGWTCTGSNTSFTIAKTNSTSSFINTDGTYSDGIAIYCDKASGATFELYSYYTITITGAPASSTPKVTIGGVAYNSGGTYLTTSETVSSNDVKPSTINGYVSTVTVDEANGTITVTYQNAAQYAYRLIGAEGDADETSSTDPVTENFWLDIKTGATTPAAEAGNASINNVAQAVIQATSTNGVYLMNADGGYLNKGSNAWSAKITSAATTEWTVAETGTGTGLYTFKQLDTNGYLYKNNYFTSGNALYINGSSGLTWKRYAWDKVHTIIDGTSVGDAVTVKTTDEGQDVIGFGSYVEGETITLTKSDPFPYSVFEVKYADGNDVAVTDNKFTMPSSNVTISAYNDYTMTITLPSGLTAADISAIAVTGGTASPYAYSSSAISVRTSKQTLSAGDVTAATVTKDGDEYAAVVTIDNTYKTILVAYQPNPYQYSYNLVLNNAPSGTTVTIENSKAGSYTQNSTVLTTTGAMTDAMVSTSNDDSDSDGNSDRHAVLVDNDARTISVTYLDKSTEYIVEVTGLEDNTLGSLVYNQIRHVNGSTFDVSTIDGYSSMTAAEIAVKLSGSEYTNYDATVTVDNDKAKIIVAYSVKENLEKVTITYNIYYEGTKYMTIQKKAEIGKPYPHIDGTSDGTDAGYAYGQPNGSISQLPYGVYASLYDVSGVLSTEGLIYDVYPSGLVNQTGTVDLNVKYFYSFNFYPEGIRFSKINQWVASIIGANGNDAADNGKNFTGMTDEQTRAIKNYYVYAKNQSLAVDTDTPVLNEDEYTKDGNTTIAAKQPHYYWAMVGNPFKFRFVNRAMGANKYLKFNRMDDDGNGYFSFDEEGTYFFCANNYSVPTGMYGAAKTGVTTANPVGLVPMVNGCSLILWDELMNKSTLYGMQYVPEGLTSEDGTKQTCVNFAKVENSMSNTIQNDPHFNVYVSYFTQSADPLAESYTVHVVAPSNNTIVAVFRMETQPIMMEQR